MRTQLLAAILASALAAPVVAEEIISRPSTDLRWEHTEEGVAFAALEDERFSEAYMAMVELPAGLVSPQHVKSATMYGVVTQGAFVHTAVGVDADKEVPLSTGSYYEIPAGVPHVSKCISQTACITFLYQDGAFDFLPVTQ